MNKTKIIIAAVFASVIGLSAFLGIANFSKANAYASTSDVTLANIDAFMSVQSLDCEYQRIEPNCEITLNAGVGFKLLGGKLIESDGDGHIVISGQVICKADGDLTCTPIECKELYETFLK